MEKYIYELKMKVRDYECDLQGIVNNANYQHYLEHTRHEFLTSEGVSFAKLHEEGVDPVVARITMAYKTPLVEGISWEKRGSMETACPRERAMLLKVPSIMWWLLLPANWRR